MREVFNLLLKRGKRSNKWLIICFIVILDLVLGLLTSLLLNPNNSINTMRISLVEKSIIVIIMAPLIETLLFQKFIISAIEKYVNNAIISIFYSAIIFGLAHNYSLVYAVRAFITGLLYGILFTICKEKHPAFYTFIAHSSYNLICFLTYEIVPLMSA